MGRKGTTDNILKIKGLFDRTGHSRATSGSSGISTIKARGVTGPSSKIAPANRQLKIEERKQQITDHQPSIENPQSKMEASQL
jgi:hypothetical protein